MAFELHRWPGIPGKAASAINVNQAVKPDVGDVQRQFLPIATNTGEPIGIAAATAANPGDGLDVYDQGHICRVTAAGSVGHGADIGVASTNGGLGIVTAASGVTVWSVGKSLTAAAAGETFSLYIRPRQLSNLA